MNIIHLPENVFENMAPTYQPRSGGSRQENLDVKQAGDMLPLEWYGLRLR